MHMYKIKYMYLLVELNLNLLMTYFDEAWKWKPERKQNQKSLKRNKTCRKATSKSSLEKREKNFTHRKIYKEKNNVNQQKVLSIFIEKNKKTEEKLNLFEKLVGSFTRYKFPLTALLECLPICTWRIWTQRLGCKGSPRFYNFSTFWICSIWYSDLRFEAFLENEFFFSFSLL